jgi:hypothetical protein
MVMDAIQAAKDQSLFRGVNERLLGMNEGFDEVSGDADFLCECASQDCIKHVSLTLDDYEEIRRVPTHFAVTDSNGSRFRGRRADLRETGRVLRGREVR